MYRIIIIIFLHCICFGLNSQSQATYSETCIILKIKEKYKDRIYNKGQFNVSNLIDLGAASGFQELKVLNPKAGDDILKLSFKKGNNIHSIARNYAATNYFDFVELDFIGQGAGHRMECSFDPNDEHFSRQWSLENNGNFQLGPSKIGADIHIKPAWEITKGSSNIIVAVLDSGIKLDHPEFQNRIWTNQDELSENSDADGNGYIGDMKGWDFANDDNDPTDDFGHGTNVAGILAANGNNMIGYSGVDWNCKIMPIKILDNENSGFYSWWIEAIYYAVNNGAHVINMSVGGISFSAAMQNAISYATVKNVAVVASMMNENNNISYYPAAYAETIAVSSTNPNDERTNSFHWNAAKGSNYGNHNDICAPGNYIFGLQYTSDSNYETYWSGTSQATPHVTGVISLLLALNQNLDVVSVRNILRINADDGVGRSTEDTPGWDQFHGAGRLNALKVLSVLSTKVEEKPRNLEFTISKNPISIGDHFIIEFMDYTQKDIRLYNINGTKVYENSTHHSIISINTNAFAAGIYILEIAQIGSFLSKSMLVIM